jgi:TATA-box binding protein (TBP) (component of TFIID and TFIIIB)
MRLNEIRENEPKITNVKCSWRIPKSSLKFSEILHNIKNTNFTGIHYKQYGFIVIRHMNKKKKFPVYTIFPSGFVNCTGFITVRNSNDAIHLFCNILNLPLKHINAYKIDNISACATIGYPINLINVDNSTTKHFPKSHYNPEKFPCIYLHFINGGCLGLFGNGRVTFVGGKSQKHINSMWNCLKQLLFKSKNTKLSCNELQTSY